MAPRQTFMTYVVLTPITG